MARLVLSMDVCHDWALRSWILSWGPFARVLMPAALAKELRSDLQAASERYDSGLSYAATFSPRDPRACGPRVLRRPLGRSLLHRLAVVRRGGISAGVSHRHARAGDAVHDRLRRGGRLADGQPAPGACVGRRSPAVFTTREGIEVPLPGRQQLRTIASGLAVVVAIIVALFASSPVGDVAGLAQSRCPSDRRIPSSDATRGSTCSRCRSCSSCAGSRRHSSPRGLGAGIALFRLRQSRLALRVGRLDDAGGAAPSRAAGGRRSCCCWPWARGSARRSG